MKFHYSFRDKTNARFDGVVSAKDRESAFKVLRSQGIKPFILEPAPGIFNNLFGRGKRWIAIVFLCVVCVALLSVALSFRKEAASAKKAIAEKNEELAVPRHQIYGDPARMEIYELTDFEDVFVHPGERILARYAQPGHLISSGKARNIREDYRRQTLSAPGNQMSTDGAAIFACLNNEIIFSDADVREVVELKQIVNWMKGELRRYLSNGIGTPDRYLQRLVGRQVQEAQIYHNAKRSLEGERDIKKIEEVNSSLRAIGLRTVPMPISLTENLD